MSHFTIGAGECHGIMNVGVVNVGQYVKVIKVILEIAGITLKERKCADTGRTVFMKRRQHTYTGRSAGV